MYSTINFKSKKALKEAVAAGQKVGVYQPNDMFGRPAPTEGSVTLEGPHYPKPHSWYAQVELKEGFIVKVR
jgi:hypothetical protein